MSVYNFDEVIPRRGSFSAKWSVYDADVIPMWVADMDFKSPPAVMERLHARVDHSVFGYTMDFPELREIIVAQLKRLYDWQVHVEDLVFVPGMVLALNIAAKTIGKEGDGILMQTPVYGPFLNIPAGNQRYAVMADLREVATGDQTFTYEIDYDVFEHSIHRQTTQFFLCNPHNPAGRIFTKDEVAQMADICLKHNLTICADEIHCDLLLNDQKHTPIAAIAPEIAQRTITLIAPSKTFNLPGLACSVAIIPNKELRKQYEMNARNLGVHVNIMGLEGAMAAYEHGDDWLKHVLDYLRANRDFMVDYLQDHIPNLRTTVPEATYLAWIDCRKLDLPEGMNAYDFFLKEAKVALNPGTFFGTGYERFVRLNFACARSVLTEGLERMRDAVKKL